MANGRLRNKAAQTPREAWNCANSYRQTWFITTGQNIRRQSKIQKIHQTPLDIREEKTLVVQSYTHLFHDSRTRPLSAT